MTNGVILFHTIEYETRLINDRREREKSKKKKKKRRRRKKESLKENGDREPMAEKKDSERSERRKEFVCVCVREIEGEREMM